MVISQQGWEFVIDSRRQVPVCGTIDEKSNASAHFPRLLFSHVGTFLSQSRNSVVSTELGTVGSSATE